MRLHEAWRKKTKRILAFALKTMTKARASSKGLKVIVQARPLPPLELSGQWVAWSIDTRELVAHADTLAEVRKQVAGMQAQEVSYEKLPSLSRGGLAQSQG